MTSTSFVWIIPNISQAVLQGKIDGKALYRFYVTSSIYLRLLYFCIISPDSQMAGAVIHAQDAEQLQLFLPRDGIFKGENPKNFNLILCLD